MEVLLTLCLIGVLNPEAANVDIWCDTPLAEIDPWVFGSGDEMDEDFVPLVELSELIGLTGVTVLRMGGIANEYYDWEGNSYNGVRYIDLLDTLIIQQNVETSMDDFLEMCEDYQIEPILSVNFQINDPSKAARLVEYCNGDQSSPMGQVRVQRRNLGNTRELQLHFSRSKRHVPAGSSRRIRGWIGGTGGNAA